MTWSELKRQHAKRQREERQQRIKQRMEHLLQNDPLRNPIDTISREEKLNQKTIYAILQGTR